MPATPEEMEVLVNAFESAHPPAARALADLLERGKRILEEHRILYTPLGEQFEEMMFKLSADHDVSRQMLNDTGAALERVRITVEQLDQLP